MKAIDNILAEGKRLSRDMGRTASAVELGTAIAQAI